MRLRFLLFLFLLLAALLLVSNGNFHLSQSEEAMAFGRLYYAWLLQVGSNLLHLTGNVALSPWIPALNQTSP